MTFTYRPHIAHLLMTVPLMAMSALADEQELRGEVFCYPAKDAVKIMGELAELSPQDRDTVDVGLAPKFLINDGGGWPEQFYLKTEGQNIDLPVEKPSGQVPTFISAINANPKSDICIRDTARAGRPQFDEGLYFEMGLSPYFLNRSGRYEMLELEEGTDDGKAFYKKMAPGLLSLFVPDTDYLAVKYASEDATPAIFAQIGETRVALEPEFHNKMYVVSLDGIKGLDATALIIEGGAYNLQPVPSVKFMKRIGWGNVK